MRWSRMKILVISDIHGNRAALEAVVAVEHDAVICLGDIVGYGPQPRECVRWIRQHADFVVQGNHDRAIAEDVSPRCRPEFEWLADAVSPWTRAELEPDDLAYLQGLPRWLVVPIDGLRIACVHAKPSDPLYGYLPPDRTLWASEAEKTPADILLVGHTHLPMGLTVGPRRVVNPGSVGQPKDGDPRASFAMIVDGVVHWHRVPYDVEATVTALEEADVAPRPASVLSEMLRTGDSPRPS